MKLRLLTILLICGMPFGANSQTKQQHTEKWLIERFRKMNWDRVVVSRDSLYTSPYREKFNIAISNNFIDFDTAHIVKENPYFSGKYEESDNEKDYVKNFPRSFSVIHENLLISLFENGKFACFKIENFQRDTSYESKLNTRKFKYHWIIDNQLAGLSGRSIYIWDGDRWVKNKQSFPLKIQPKLFEDDKFIVYRNCHGEWGGTVYFFDKKTSKTYFTESTCANSVFRDSNGYNVLAALGHMQGSTELKVIPDPTKLTLAKPGQIGTTIDGQALGYTDKSNSFDKKFDFYGIIAFSSFDFRDRHLYIFHLFDLTFIAEIKNGQVEIVNPLFFNDLYTHYPVTTSYGRYTLINLDHYGTGLNREISVLILDNNRITKLDWNEDHN